MTEKRSDYRKRQQTKKTRAFFKNIKSAFSENDEVSDETELEQDDRRPLVGNGEEVNVIDDDAKKIVSSEDQALKLKKKLNRVIFILVVLIALVLLALFKL